MAAQVIRNRRPWAERPPPGETHIVGQPLPLSLTPDRVKPTSALWYLWQDHNPSLNAVNT